MKTSNLHRRDGTERGEHGFAFLKRNPLRVLCLLLAALLLNADPCVAEGLFIAVGGGGRIMSSRDGLNWETAQEWDSKCTTWRRSTLATV